MNIIRCLKAGKKLSYSDDTEGSGEGTAAPLGKAVSPLILKAGLTRFFVILESYFQIVRIKWYFINISISLPRYFKFAYHATTLHLWLCIHYVLHIHCTNNSVLQSQLRINFCVCVCKVFMKLNLLLTQSTHYILSLWNKIDFSPPSLFNWLVRITFFDMGQYNVFLVDSYFVPFCLLFKWLYSGILVEGRLVHNVETSPRVKISFIPFSCQTALLHEIKSEKKS